MRAVVPAIRAVPGFAVLQGGMTAAAPVRRPYSACVVALARVGCRIGGDTGDPVISRDSGQWSGQHASPVHSNRWRSPARRRLCRCCRSGGAADPSRPDQGCSRPASSGDGTLDFEAIVKRLASHRYEGWFVVEAEQDPKKAPPLEWSTKGNVELHRVMKAAGYEVV